MLTYMINHPRVLCFCCLVALWLTARFGAWLSDRFCVAYTEERDNLSLVISATLTLLGLIIGFTFSMAAGRYDQRRLFEEEEANAIGTEYVRADLLPPDQAAALKSALADYLQKRIQFYQVDYGDQLDAVDAATAEAQAQLWRLVLPQAAAQPTPVTALVVSGMNDVLNRQGYTQFAWWNRIPTAAWTLMLLIALLANGMVGYVTRRTRSGKLLLFVLPLITSISLFLVADIDSPRGGIIRIPPRDLMSLSSSLKSLP